MKILIKLGLFLTLVLLLVNYSCEEDENNQLEKPIIENQYFSISESCENGTIIDTVQVKEINDNNKLEYSIIGGNINNAFLIETSTGIIKVNNAISIDYELIPYYELAVEIKNSSELTSSATIGISVIDVKEIPLNGIVSYYPFSGNYYDISGNNYHLNNYGVNLVYDRNNIALEAAYFNGTSGLLLTNQSLSNQSEAQTISLWFKTNSLNSVDQGGVLCAIVGSSSAGTSSRFIVCIKDGKIECSYGDEYGEDNTWLEFIISENTYNDNQWHHLAYISHGDNNFAYLIIDGDIVNGKLLSKTNNENTTGLNIKIGGYKPENYYTGELDDIIIYRKALTLEEVLDIYYEN